MEKLSIKIRIADREYPMKVKADEEERVRAASKQVNESVKMYRERFGINDKQDLLAMVAFDSLVNKMEFEATYSHMDESMSQKINHLNTLINQAL